MSVPRASLLEPTGAPVLGTAVEWLAQTVTGSIAIALCTIAVAMVGVMMFEGRMPIRRGLRVIIGCFVVFGAPAIAAGLLGTWQTGAEAPPPAAIGIDPATMRGAPAPMVYDPATGTWSPRQ